MSKKWVAKLSASGARVGVGPKGKPFVAVCSPAGGDMWKNAYLISAAPDLLDALENIYRNGIGSSAMCRAGLAIAKAKGEK